VKKPAITDGFLNFREKDLLFLKALVPYGKGFLQPLPVFCFRYHPKVGHGVRATIEETTFIIELLEIFQN